MSEFNPEFAEFNKNIHDRDSFDCGEHEVTNFFKCLAAQHSKKGLSKTYVLPSNTPLSNRKFQVIAFYSISSSLVKNEDLTPKEASKLPKHPIPAILIGQLGVKKDYHGTGLGQATLICALKMAYRISLTLGAYAVLVDCLNDSITRFYESYGFEYLSSADGKVRMFLPMKTIAQLM